VRFFLKTPGLLYEIGYGWRVFGHLEVKDRPAGAPERLLLGTRLAFISDGLINEESQTTTALGQGPTEGGFLSNVKKIY
jgi:hypothetical protein